MKKKIYTLSVLLAAVLPAGAQSIKSDINTVLNDIALPVFLGVMVMALAVGIGKNWRLINDETNEGNKKQGWMNVAYMVGYVLIAVTVISFCVGKIAVSASQSDRHGVQGAQRDREPVQDTRAAGTRLLSVARLRRIRRGRTPAERQELAGGRYDRR